MGSVYPKNDKKDYKEWRRLIPTNGIVDGDEPPEKGLRRSLKTGGVRTEVTGGELLWKGLPG